MNMKISAQTGKKQNQGFSLFTVIISVSFIGILGMLMLYIAVANFQMKTSDLQGKDSFYTAERALEEVRTGLQEDVGDAMSRAYITVMESYNRAYQDGQTQDEALDEQRLSDFRTAYVKELGALLQGEAAKETDTAEGGGALEPRRSYSLDHLNDYLDITKNPEAYDEMKETVIVTTPADKQPLMVLDAAQGVYLRNLKVIYVDARGYASIIETDIHLGIPKIQFPTPSTLPDLMNMIVVAQGGIICEGTMATETTSIEGSVYAGLIDKESNAIKEGIRVEAGAQLKVSGGDRVVTQGEITVKDGGSFESAGEVTLWAQGITLAEAEVSLHGKTYLADDLTVEAGSNSNVTVEGEFYGYGSPESAKASHNKDYFDGWTDAALSSAMVINGKNTTLDLSGVEKIMLAGKNYIAGKRVRPWEGKSNQNVMMGESVSVKGTQLAYLLPAELISGGIKPLVQKLHNPMTYDEYMLCISNGNIDEWTNDVTVNWDLPVEAWGGLTLAQIGVDRNRPVRMIFYNSNAGNGGVYLYLNFTSDEAATAFMETYYRNNPVVKTNMDKYLSFYFGGESGVRVNDSQTYLRYVTNGNVLAYENQVNEDGSVTGEGSLIDATVDASDEDAVRTLLQEQINYQNMWFALNRKMIGSYDLLNKEVSDLDGGEPHDETRPDRGVFDNLVNEDKMKAFIAQHHTGENDYTYHFPEVPQDGELEAYMLDNEGRDVFRITKANEEKIRLVVCTGDVVIEDNVKFQGIIMAKGKIILGSGATLKAAPQEAARVFQAQMNDTEGTASPKDFFWEGEKYVLGNSSTTEDGGNTNRLTTTYDISDSITYENWRKR